jgi:hypothetical protein
VNGAIAGPFNDSLKKQIAEFLFHFDKVIQRDTWSEIGYICDPVLSVFERCL